MLTRSNGAPVEIMTILSFGLSVIILSGQNNIIFPSSRSAISPKKNIISPAEKATKVAVVAISKVIPTTINNDNRSSVTLHIGEVLHFELTI